MTTHARTTLTTVAVTLALAAALTGCGGASRPAASAPAAPVPTTTTPTGTGVPSSRPSPTAPSPVVFSTFPPAPFASPGTVTAQPKPVVPPAGPVAFAGPVAARFGAAQTAAAYRVATRLELATTFDPTVLAVATPTLAQVEPVAGPYLDPAGKAALAASTAHGDEGDSLYALFTYAVGDGEGYTLRGAGVSDAVAGPPTDAEVHHTAHGDELYLRFTVTGDLLLAHAGKPVTVPVSKDCVLELTPTSGTGQDGWLVDQWFGETDLGNPVAA